MQRPKVKERGSFTMSASTNVAALQCVDQVFVCKEAVKYKSTAGLNRSSEDLCEYKDIHTEVAQMGLRMGCVNGE